jgi:predicted negative regulator of RcsB-dependent stress response
MSDYLSDEEQVERLKKWMKTYGSSVLTGVLLALIAFFGWHYWQNRQTQINIEMMNQYQGILEDSAKATTDKSEQSRFISSVQTLVRVHPDSVFALNALLMQAKVTADQGEWASAEKALTQAVGLKVKAQNKLDAALVSLKNVKDPAFSASADELRGDILVQKNDIASAKSAYASAWSSLVKRQQSRQLLKVKMNAFGLEPIDIVNPNPIRDVPQISAIPNDIGAAS